MIIKILDEMRQVRIKEDYQNYRMLISILDDYLYNEIYSVPSNQFNEEKHKKINTIIKWIYSEIEHINELVNKFLKDKEYKNFKITSQGHNNLLKIKDKLESYI